MFFGVLYLGVCGGGREKRVAWLGLSGVGGETKIGGLMEVRKRKY